MENDFQISVGTLVWATEAPDLFVAGPL